MRLIGILNVLRGFKFASVSAAVSLQFTSIRSVTEDATARGASHDFPTSTLI
jgi:hypothetical protein